MTTSRPTVFFPQRRAPQLFPPSTLNRAQHSHGHPHLHQGIPNGPGGPNGGPNQQMIPGHSLHLNHHPSGNMIEAVDVELQSVRSLFGEKVKELSVAVAKVDALTKQLEELKKGNTTNSYHVTTCPGGGSKLNREFEKLRQELLYRSQLLDDQSSELSYKKNILQNKRAELATIDDKILQLQQRLSKKKQINQRLSTQIQGSSSSASSTTSSLSSTPLVNHQGHILANHPPHYQQNHHHPNQPIHHHLISGYHPTSPLRASVGPGFRSNQRLLHPSHPLTHSSGTMGLNVAAVEPMQRVVSPPAAPSHASPIRISPSGEQLEIGDPKSNGQFIHQDVGNNKVQQVFAPKSPAHLNLNQLKIQPPTQKGGSTITPSAQPVRSPPLSSTARIESHAISNSDNQHPQELNILTLVSQNHTTSSSESDPSLEEATHPSPSSHHLETVTSPTVPATTSENESQLVVIPITNTVDTPSTSQENKSLPNHEPHGITFSRVLSNATDTMQRARRRAPVMSLDDDMERVLSAPITSLDPEPEQEHMSSSPPSSSSSTSGVQVSSDSSSGVSYDSPDFVSSLRIHQDIIDSTSNNNLHHNHHIHQLMHQGKSNLNSLSSDSSAISSDSSSSPVTRRTNLKNLKQNNNNHHNSNQDGTRNGLPRRVSFDPLALLLDAALEGELDLVKKTAAQVPDPSAVKDEGITALHNAICAGHISIVRYLVEIGCDVNAQDSDGWTPLHCAASCNNLPMVEFLVNRGACIFATTFSDQETAAEKCEEDEVDYEHCSQFLYGVQERLGLMNGGVVYAVYDYEAQNEDELSYSVGDMMVVMRKGDDQELDWWWSRKTDGKEGYVARNLLGLYPRVKNPRGQ